MSRPKRSLVVTMKKVDIPMYIAVQCYPSYVDHYLNYQMLILIVNGVGEGGGQHELYHYNSCIVLLAHKNAY